MKQFYSSVTCRNIETTFRKIVMMFLAFFVLGSLTVITGQTITTDKDDYSPGETVIITGTGWLPGETVRLYIEKEPPITEPVTLYAIADGSGNIRNEEYIVIKEDLGVEFTITATGLESGLTAVAVFTDGGASATLDQVRNGPASSPYNLIQW
ncbi:MAG: hypothetical protein RQ737_09060, partial [Bacteroidales bacterium]|nr:hypothetical protein [Bacteroidales bacterium]